LCLSLHYDFTLSSWVFYVFMAAAGSAVIALTCASYFTQIIWSNFCPQPPYIKSLVAALALSLLVFAQCVSNRVGYYTSNTFAIVKVGSLIVIIFCGLIYVALNGTTTLDQPFDGTTSNPGSYVFAFFSAYWAFSGTTGFFQVLLAYFIVNLTLQLFK